MTDTLITDVQQGIIDQLDTTALNVIIWDYLNNPDNGFMDYEEIVTITDATACTIIDEPLWDGTTYVDTTSCVYLDTTSITQIDTTSLWTVEEWKEEYLEYTYNDAQRTQDRISFEIEVLYFFLVNNLWLSLPLHF